MKAVTIDFAPRGLFQTVWRTSPQAWIILGLGVCLCLGAALTVGRFHAQQRVYEAEQMRARATREVTRSLASSVSVSPEKANAVNAAIAQLNLPWLDMQDAIVNAATPGVALLVLEPQAKQRTIKIVAEAKTSDDMLLYIEQLKHQSFLRGVVLVKHAVSEQDPNRPLRFQLEAQWGDPSAGNGGVARP